MKILVAAALPAIFLSGEVCFAQNDKPTDPYKPILERLESLETMALPEWRYHDDIAHPEDPGLNDANWPVVKSKEEWKSGARVREFERSQVIQRRTRESGRARLVQSRDRRQSFRKRVTSIMATQFHLLGHSSR